MRQRFATGTALRPYVAERHAHAVLRSVVGHHGQLGLGIRQSAIDRHHHRHAELAHVGDMMREMRQSALEGTEVFLVEHVLGQSALHLERPHGGHQHRGFGIESAGATLDIEELFGAQVGAEAGFGDHDVGQGETGARGHEAVAAVRDIAEGAGVQNGRAAFERLHEVGAQRILEQQRHGSGGLQITRANGCAFLPARGAHDDVAEALLEIFGVGGECHDRHDLAGGDDHPALFAHHAVASSHTDDGLTERAVVHVDRTRPGDPLDVESERIPVIQVVVEHGRQQTVRAGDGVKVAREVQVDVVHRQHLRVATAGGAPFYTEYGAETWFTHAEHGVVSEPTKRLAEPHADGAFSFTGRRGTDRGDQHQSPLGRLRGQRERQFGLEAPVLVDVVRAEPEVGRDRGDRAQARLLRNLDIRRDHWRRASHTARFIK